MKAGDITIADLILATHDHADHCGDAVELPKRTGATVVTQPETVDRFKMEMGLQEDNVIFGGISINGGGVPL